MAWSFAAIREGLKVRLDTITSPAWQTYARPPDDIVTPCALVVPDEPPVVFDSTMNRGSDELNFVIFVLIGAADDDLAQALLDPYLDGSGAQSVKAAVEGGATLGGIVSYARVALARRYGDIEYAGTRYIGAEFAVEVLT